MSQPPQGPNPYQPPYGQPTPPASGWNQGPYSGTPGQPYPGAAGQAPYPGAPAPQPYGYPPAYQAPVVAKPRGKGLGIAGFAMVLIGAAVGIWGSWLFGTAFGDLILRTGIPLEQLDRIDPSMLPDAELAAIGVAIMPALVASLIGLVGWILCIVATVKGSARPLAIVGIVLGVLAPIAEYLTAVAGMVNSLGLTP
jgi:hypothetical protein